MIYKQRGFTLIELLVVISIISLLSSIIMASLNTARDKAQLAAGKKFNTHTYRAFGSDAVAIWNFDGESGTTVTDRSGNNNTLTGLTGHTWPASTISTGNALQLSGAGSGQVATPVGLSPSITISAWVYVNTHGNWNQFVWHNWANAGGWNLTTDSNGLVVFAARDGLNIVQYNAVGSAIKTGQWYHLAATFDDVTKKLQVFVNGKPGTPATGNAMLVLNTTSSVRIGTMVGAIVDDVHIYKTALPVASIQQLYAEGLSRRALAQAE